MTTKSLSLQKISDPEVAAVFRSYPANVRPHMRKLRAIIIKTAREIENLGVLEETLKWGEPSYLTSESKMGSTLRIDWKPKDPEYVAIYFKCTSNLVATFKKKFKALNYEGNRSIRLGISEEFPENELRQCIALALTYHHNKKLQTKARWQLVSKLTNVS